MNVKLKSFIEASEISNKTDDESPESRRFKAYVEQIGHLGYRERREFLWNHVRPRLSRFLYKFRALEASNEVSVDRMRDILVRSQLWLSSPIDFNDPFDMCAKFVAEGTIKEKRLRLRELLKLIGVRWAERERQLPQLVAKPNPELAATAQAVHRREVESTGVYSFGGDPRSILMWSHYARNHEGLCLQFEVAKDPTVFMLALRVQYSDEYPVVNWLTGSREDLEPVILRKYTGWSYERERRIVVPNAARQFLRFRPEALRGIIIGCRAGDATRVKLSELMAERCSGGIPRPQLYRAVQHESNYKLVIKALE